MAQAPGPELLRHDDIENAPWSRNIYHHRKPPLTKHPYKTAATMFRFVSMDTAVLIMNCPIGTLADRVLPAQTRRHRHPLPQGQFPDFGAGGYASEAGVGRCRRVRN